MEGCTKGMKEMEKIGGYTWCHLKKANFEKEQFIVMRSSAQQVLREELKAYINQADERTLRLMHAIIEADKDWGMVSAKQKKRQ